jgi:hypothetical protein
MTITATYIPSPSTTTEARTSLLKVGVLASIAGAGATEAFSLIARAVDVPMKAADPGATAAKLIPVGGFATGVLMNAAIGLVIAFALRRWAKRPAHTFAVTTITLTVLSLLGPALATHTTFATKVVLAVAHVIAAAVIIPPVTRTLADA